MLSILFNLAFSNISKSESFTGINIAIVNDAGLKHNQNFIKAIEAVSTDKAGAKNRLFYVRYTSKQEAVELLKDNQIEGCIYFDSGFKLIVKKSGINQTIIKSFLDDYEQTSKTLETIISNNPSAVQNGLIESTLQRGNFLRETPISKSSPDPSVHYFYSLIAFACLYGSFLGLREVTDIQADLSPSGARINIAPVHKLKLFTASILAAATIQIIAIIMLLLFMMFVLKVNFGNQLGYVALTCIIGSITGVSFGTCVASIIKRGEGVKIAVLISSSMILSFLSGLMYSDIKYIISTTVPVLGYINPANLITDSLYSLYYYNTHTQFFGDISGLCLCTAVFSLITYLIVRRQKYASL